MLRRSTPATLPYASMHPVLLLDIHSSRALPSIALITPTTLRVSFGAAALIYWQREQKGISGPQAPPSETGTTCCAVSPMRRRSQSQRGLPQKAQ